MFMNDKLRNPVTVLNSKPENAENKTIDIDNIDLNAPVKSSRFGSIISGLVEDEAYMADKLAKRREEYRNTPKRQTKPTAKTQAMLDMLPSGSKLKPIDESTIADTTTKTKSKKTKGADEPEVDPRELPDFYEKRFEKPLQLVTNIIEEFDSKKDRIEDEVTQLRAKANRNSAVLEYIAKQDSNVTSLLNNKLSAVKEITNIYTKISDLEMKKSNQTSKTTGAENSSAIISKVYERMMGDKDPFSLNDLYDSGYLKDFNPAMSYNDAVDADLDRRYAAAVQSGGIFETNADVNLKYADRQVEIRVLRSECSDSWRFIAVDLQLEEEIPDYAKPSVIGTMRFDFDNLIARDNLRTYPLILVPSEVDMEDDAMFITDFTSNDDDDNGYFGYHR